MSPKFFWHIYGIFLRLPMLCVAKCRQKTILKKKQVFWITSGAIFPRIFYAYFFSNILRLFLSYFFLEYFAPNLKLSFCGWQLCLQRFLKLIRLFKTHNKCSVNILECVFDVFREFLTSYIVIFPQTCFQSFSDLKFAKM